MLTKLKLFLYGSHTGRSRIWLRTNQMLLGVLALAAVASSLFIIMTGIGATNFGDAGDYLRGANAFYNHLAFPRDGSWPYFRPPGYPMIISLWWNITFTHQIWSLKILNILLHIGSTYLIFKLSNRLTNKKVAVSCAIFYAINPFSLLQVVGVQTEPLITLLFLAFVYLILNRDKSRNFLPLVLVTVISVSVRPEYVFIMVPIIVYFLFKNSLRSISTRNLTGVLVILALSLTFWGFQNKKNDGGGFLLLTDATNYQLWLGSTPIIAQNYPVLEKYSADFNRIQFQRVRESILNIENNPNAHYSSLSIIERSEFWKSLYLENVNQNRSTYFRNTLMKATVFWRPFLSPASYSPRVSLGSAILLVPFNIFFLFGLIKFWRERRDRQFLCAFIFSLLVLTGIHAVQMPDMRYRVPIFMPFAIMMAGILIGEWALLKFQNSRFRFASQLLD